LHRAYSPSSTVRYDNKAKQQRGEGGREGGGGARGKMASTAIISAANMSNHAEGIAKVVAVMAAYPADADVRQEEACVALSILARRSAEYEEVSAWMYFLARRQPRVLGGECGGHSSGWWW